MGASEAGTQIGGLNCWIEGVFRECKTLPKVNTQLPDCSFLDNPQVTTHSITSADLVLSENVTHADPFAGLRR